MWDKEEEPKEETVVVPEPQVEPEVREAQEEPVVVTPVRVPNPFAGWGAVGVVYSDMTQPEVAPPPAPVVEPPFESFDIQHPVSTRFESTPSAGKDKE